MKFFIYTTFVCIAILLAPRLMASIESADQAYREEKYDIAFQAYQPLAEAGNPHAQARLGVMYFWGRGTFRSESQAFIWSLKAAKQNDPAAQHMVGYLYENGIYVPKDIRKAIEWYERSAELGYAPSQANLAGIYMLSEEVPHDFKRGFKMAKAAAEQGNRHAEYLMGHYYQHQNSDYDLARKWYVIAAKNGNANAANILGKFYFNGERVAKDYQKAFFWFRIAERSDLAEGLVNRERAQKLLETEDVIELEKQVDKWFADVEKAKLENKNKEVDKLKAIREILEIDDI